MNNKEYLTKIKRNKLKKYNLKINNNYGLVY